MTVIPLQQTSSVTAPFRLASLRDSPVVHPRGVGWKPHRWGTARDDRGGRINTGKTCFVRCICKFTCKYSLNTCKSMKLGNWHQIDLKYIHKTCSTLPLCHARHALLQADRDGDGLINPDEFYRVMRKSWHPKMLRMRSMEMYGDYLGTNITNCSFSGIHLLGFMGVCDERHWFTSPRRGTNPLDDWDSDEDWADQVRAEWLGGLKCIRNGSLDHLDLFKFMYPLSIVFI